MGAPNYCRYNRLNFLPAAIRSYGNTGRRLCIIDRTFSTEPFLILAAGRSTMRIGASLALAAFSALLTLSAGAQTRDSGPWWPHPEWGPDDQAGASNRITEAKVVEALRLATAGRIYELGQIYEQGMPLFGSRSYSMVLPARGPAAGDNRIVANEEFLSTQIGQVGTQFDGLGHVGQEVVMEDGSVEHVFYNGFTASEMDTPSGLQRLGIEHVRPIVTRGVLIDIAGYQGVARLDNSYEVTVEDLLGALAAQGMSAADVTPGDALLLRYGWSSLWDQPEAYNHNPPGIGLAAGRMDHPAAGDHDRQRLLGQRGDSQPR